MSLKEALDIWALYPEYVIWYHKMDCVYLHKDTQVKFTKPYKKLEDIVDLADKEDVIYLPHRNIVLLRQYLDEYKYKLKPIICLEYALQVWNNDNEYKIWYNSCHCINLDIRTQVEFKGRQPYLPLESYGYNNIKTQFANISEAAKIMLGTYFLKYNSKSYFLSYET